MKNFMFTMGVGLSRIMSKRFQKVSIDDFRTSKSCCLGHKELCHLKVKKDDRNERVYRYLVCKECESSVSKRTVFLTRDLNSALNIRNLAIAWLATKTRAPAFHRGTE
jgi:hypothetical protein